MKLLSIDSRSLLENYCVYHAEEIRLLRCHALYICSTPYSLDKAGLLMAGVPLHSHCESHSQLAVVINRAGKVVLSHRQTTHQYLSTQSWLSQPATTQLVRVQHVNSCICSCKLPSIVLFLLGLVAQHCL